MDTKQVQGIKLMYLSEKDNDYGFNHLFEVLDVEPLRYIFALNDDDMNLPFWSYSEKYYLKINDKKLIDYHGNKPLKKTCCMLRI